MALFIKDFEKLHNQLDSFGCKYPDGVLAFRLMKSASMSKEHEELVRVTIDNDKWSYQSVKQQIKIFNDYVAVNTESSSSEKSLPVKVEETFFTEQAQNNLYGVDNNKK